VTWYVNTDGGSRGNPGTAGYGVVIHDDAGAVVGEISAYVGQTTNNVAEYRAVVDALTTLNELGVDGDVVVRADSKLVVEQLTGRWKIKNPDMQELARQAKAALDPQRVRYQWVPRAQNAAADRLANKAMDTKADFRRGSLFSQPPQPSQPVPAAPPAPAVHSRGTRPSGAYFHSGTSTTVVFLRHGETAMTESGGFSGGGLPGPELSDRGRAQVRNAAQLLARFDSLWTDLPMPSAVWASPMVRTQQTARAMAEVLGCGVVVEEGLREVEFGAWEGLTGPQIEAQYPGALERWYHDVQLAPPGGETVREVAERVVPVARRALLEHPGQTVVLATHSTATKAAVGSLMGLEMERWLAVRIPPASLTVVRLWRDAAELVVAGLPTELAPQDSAALF